MSDLISRQQAIESVHKEFDECLVWDESGEYTADEIERILEQLPSAERTGHWIDTGSGQECSSCGEIQYGYDTGRHYCPNCGARMEVEHDES